MLNQNTPIQSRSVQSKSKISLNIVFVYVLAVVLIGFGEREEIAEGISELAELTVSAINPNPEKPAFHTYRVESQDIPFAEWRNPYLYFKTAYITEQDIIDMPSKYQASLEHDEVEKATDSG